MKTSMKKRVLAFSLVALMVVGLIPTGFLSKEVKGAENKTYTATSGEINSYFTITTDATDDSGNSKKYYKIGDTAKESTGRIKLNTGSSKASTVSNNSIAFTVSEGATATVKVWAISSSSTADGKIGVYKEDGTEVTVVTAYPTKSADKGYTGDSATEYGKKGNPIEVTMEVENLAAGKYYIGSPAGQGANVYYVSVEEKVVAPVIKDYTATSGEINSYFTITTDATDDSGNSKKYYKIGDTAKESTGRIKLNTGSSKASTVSNNSIAFTVSEGATATVKVWAISSSSTADGKIGVYKEDGTEVTVVTAYPTKSADKGYTGDSATEYGKKGNPIEVTMEVENLAAGKYYIGSPAGQGANVYYVSVTESTGGSPEVTPVNAPTATEITAVQNEEALNKVEITIKGTPAATNSADSKYTIVRFNKDKADDKGTVVTNLDGTKSEDTYTDELSSSGRYEYQVYGSGDSNTAALTADTVIKYVAKPSVKAQQVSGKLAIKATWGLDDYATKYVITVTSSEGTVVETKELEKTVKEYTTTAELKDGYKYNVVVEMICANADDNVKSEAVSVRPYNAINMSNAFPGMKVANGYNGTSKVGKLFVLRDKGNMSVSQTSNGSSKIASSGSESTTYVYADKTSKDFTISALISVTGMERSDPKGNNQQGIFVGATAEIPGTPVDGKKESITKIASVELGTNKVAYAAYYEAIEAGKFGRALETAEYSFDTFYKVSVSRSGAKYTLSVSGTDDKSVYSKEVEVQDDSFKGEVYPAILLAGVDAEVKELKLVVDGKTVVDSTTYTDSFAPYVDNWEDAEAPVIYDNTAKKEDPELNKIYIKVNGDFSETGASSVKVFMKDENGKTVGTSEVTKDGGEASFSPKSSGKYYFIAMATRKGEEKNIYAKDVVTVDFDYKMPTPGFVSITNDGNYSVRYKWSKVNEAEKYRVSYKLGDGAYSTPVEVKDIEYTFKGLTAGNYTFKVCAVKGSYEGEGLEKSIGVTDKAETEWMYSTFGGSNATDSKGKNSASGNPNAATVENPVKVNSGIPSENILGGKLVTGASADEISYFYTELKSNMNFTLKAKVHVNSLKEDGGQVGFGLMATDTVDESSKGSAYYTNSVATFAGKVEYYYDEELGMVTTDTSKTKYSIYNGLGARYKVGSIDTATPGNGSVVLPLTTDPSDKALDGATKWNVIGADSLTNATGTNVPDAVYNDFYIELKKDNTGFLCTFYDSNGKEIKKQRIYDLDNEYLTTIDKDTYNVGFFAARCVDVQFTDITFTTIDSADDAPAEDVEYTLIPPTATVTTTNATGCADYVMQFVANADGVVTITAPDGTVLVDNKTVKANEVIKAPSYTLTYGKKNEFKITFTPDKDYVPGKYQKLSSYDTIEQTFNVSYIKYGTAGQSIWVSPDGSNKGNGTKKKPLDIYTAVKYVQPGQQIIIMEGTYYLDSTVKVARGVNGTEDAMIYLIADPDAKTRPVFDFQKLCAGFVFAGDYWYVQGFDVTHSGDKLKAVQVSGNNNTLDQINAYYNGDTGIQISRLLSSDADQSMWPSNNTILNCSSYNNADPTYADADGFAAKITVGTGNVFDGCISHHNADDGWDLFAYPDTGAIGSVLIKNSIAYMNGYVIKDDEGNLDMNGGKLINAGNGNGFKMGGNSISGYHKLVNSIAFENKAKGIDCNSCPDIQIEMCTSVNNGSYNVALYSGSAKNTDFSAKGVISFRTNNAISVIDTDGDYVDTTGDKGVKMVGNQDISKVINKSTYLWMPSYVPEVADKFESFMNSLSANGVIGYGSFNSAGNKVSEGWFVNLDTANPNIVRNADGSINMNGLLALTDEADVNAGARMTNTLSKQFVGYAPVTGDNNNILLLVAVIALSLMAITGVVVVDKKRKATK